MRPLPFLVLLGWASLASAQAPATEQAQRRQLQQRLANRGQAEVVLPGTRAQAVAELKNLFQGGNDSVLSLPSGERVTVLFAEEDGATRIRLNGTPAATAEALKRIRVELERRKKN